MTLGCRDGFITIASDEFEGLVRFYQQLLTRSPEVLIPKVYAEFKLPGIRLGIFKPSANQCSDFLAPSSGAMSICLEVADLNAAIAHGSTVDGAKTSKIITAAHGQEVYLYDPAGNRVILHQTFP